MSIRIPLGPRVFAPSWALTVLTLIACLAFVHLGRWQYHKGVARQAQWDQFALGTEQQVALGSRGLDEVPLFQRVSLSGQWDPAHQFLLDNQIHEGRAGFDVLTPLRRADGRVALVDRGWVPFSGVRTQLPDVTLAPQSLRVLSGRVAMLPSAGLQSGRSSPSKTLPWPKITAFPVMSQLQEALGAPLEGRIVLLDREEPDGYVRDWHPTGLEPMRYFSYAVQWWGFAILALALWIGLNLRKSGSGAR